MRRPVTIADINNLHRVEVYTDNPDRQDLILSSFTREDIRDLLHENQSLRDQLTDRENKIEFQKTELKNLNEKFNSQGFFKKLGIKLDNLLKRK